MRMCWYELLCLCYDILSKNFWCWPTSVLGAITHRPLAVKKLSTCQIPVVTSHSLRYRRRTVKHPLPVPNISVIAIASSKYLSHCYILLSPDVCIRLVVFGINNYLLLFHCRNMERTYITRVKVQLGIHPLNNRLTPLMLHLLIVSPSEITLQIITIKVYLNNSWHSIKVRYMYCLIVCLVAKWPDS